MNQEMKKALVDYARAIQDHGWEAGEHLIFRNERRFPGFRRWAYALIIVLRVEELLAL